MENPGSDHLKNKLKLKITADLFCKNINNSFKGSNGVFKLDDKSASLLLEMCGYSLVSKRDLDLYVYNENKDDVIVLDAGFGRYKTDIDDVALRKSPTLKEMVSFRNAKKILSDSDVLTSSKSETVEFLRNSLFESLDFSFKPEDIDDICRKGLVELEANAFDDFFKTVLICSELLGFNYLRGQSKKYDAYFFGKKGHIENEAGFEKLIIIDDKENKFIYSIQFISEKNLKKFFEGSLPKPGFFMENKDGFEAVAKDVKALTDYDPHANDIFSFGSFDGVENIY